MGGEAGRTCSHGHMLRICMGLRLQEKEIGEDETNNRGIRQDNNRLLSLDYILILIGEYFLVKLSNSMRLK